MNRMKVIVNCVISWNYLNRDLFEPYGLAPEDRRPKAISYEVQSNINDLPPLGEKKVDLVYFHEGTGINPLESEVLSNIYTTADKVFTIIHKPILKSWRGMPLLNQMIEHKPCFPPIPTHSTHGPFINLMYQMGESFQNGSQVEYESNFTNLWRLADSQPNQNRKKALFNAALAIMNQTLNSTGTSRILWMADSYQDLFLRRLLKKPGVRPVLEEMSRQYDLQAPVSSLREELHKLLFAEME